MMVFKASKQHFPWKNERKKSKVYPADQDSVTSYMKIIIIMSHDDFRLGKKEAKVINIILFK